VELPDFNTDDAEIDPEAFPPNTPRGEKEFWDRNRNVPQ
jgi:hypothetical protein